MRTHALISGHFCIQQYGYAHILRNSYVATLSWYCTLRIYTVYIGTYCAISMQVATFCVSCELYGISCDFFNACLRVFFLLPLSLPPKAHSDNSYLYCRAGYAFLMRMVFFFLFLEVEGAGRSAIYSFENVAAIEKFCDFFFLIHFLQFAKKKLFIKFAKPK